MLSKCLSNWSGTVSYTHLSYETRQRLAAKVFRHTAAYDALIAEYLTAQVSESKPEKLTLTYDLSMSELIEITGVMVVEGLK